MANPPIERLHFALTELVVLERRIRRIANDLHGNVSSHPAAQELLGRLEEMACTHLDALRERMLPALDSILSRPPETMARRRGRASS